MVETDCLLRVYLSQFDSLCTHHTSQRIETRHKLSEFILEEKKK